MRIVIALCFLVNGLLFPCLTQYGRTVCATNQDIIGQNSEGETSIKV